MSPEKHVTDGDSGAQPAVETNASEGLAAPSDKVETNEPASTPVETEPVITPVEPPRRSEPKADSRAKPKAFEEPKPPPEVKAPEPKAFEEPKPAPEVKAPEPKSLAQIMKVDLRGRKRRI